MFAEHVRYRPLCGMFHFESSISLSSYHLMIHLQLSLRRSRAYKYSKSNLVKKKTNARSKRKQRQEKPNAGGVKLVHSLDSEVQESWKRWVTGLGLTSPAASAEGHVTRHVMLGAHKAKLNRLLRSWYETESNTTLFGPEVDRNISLWASEG